MEDIDRDQVFITMRSEDMDKLSDAQLQMAQQVAMRRVNKRAQEKIRDLLRDKDEDVLSAMTLPPFIYVSDELQVMSGLKIKLSSMNRAQVNDAYACADRFAISENPNGIRLSNELNRNLLAYSLVEMNGSPFGDMEMPEDFAAVSRSDPKGAEETLKAIRDARIGNLDAMPSPVVDRLVEHYHAFQMALDAITRGEDLGKLLGN